MGHHAEDFGGGVGGTQRLHALRGVALAQALPPRVGNERQMGKPWRLEPEKPVQINLLGSRQQQVVAAHHLGDPHQRVIYHDRELVRPRPVGPAHDEIAAVSGEVEPLRASNKIVEADVSIRHPQPHSPGSGKIDISARHNGRTARARVDHASVRLVRRLRSHHVGSRAPAFIYVTLACEPFEILGVNLPSPTLRVRSVGPHVVEAPLIPVQAQPVQIILDESRIFKLRPLRVKILDTQNPPTPATAHRQPRHHRRVDITQVHTPRRRRRKPPNYFARSFHTTAKLTHISQNSKI